MIILFVDDDKEDYEMFCDAAQTLNPNLRCIHAIDGQQALDLLSNVIPDFIFLDINMPVMGGEECLIRIKQKKAWRQIPVIIYSTTRHPNEIKTFKMLGAQDFIAKPPVFNELVLSLKPILNTNR